MVAFLLGRILCALATEPVAAEPQPDVGADVPVILGDGPVDPAAASVRIARPSVVLPSSAVVSTGLLTVVVVPGGGGVREGVSLDGCVPIEIERWEAGVWTRTAPRGCTGGEPAIAVGARLSLSVPAPTPGRWRVVAGWGARCQPDLPLAFASCADMGVAVSEGFDVRPPASR
jgi:hypothetical protein